MGRAGFLSHCALHAVRRSLERAAAKQLEAEGECNASTEKLLLDRYGPHNLLAHLFLVCSELDMLWHAYLLDSSFSQLMDGW